MTLRCALYARYSSDRQRAASIEDEFRICREHAERDDWRVEDTYRDAAISGASVILRPGVQVLLEGARRGLLEVVAAEALDRVSRNQADVAILYKHLCFADVKLVTLAEGKINELHVGLKGTMNTLFLKDLAAKTHRGIRGRVEAGKAGGGRSYVRGMSNRLRALEARQDEIAARFSAAPAYLPDIHPNVATVYRRKVERLTACAEPTEENACVKRGVHTQST